MLFRKPLTTMIQISVSHLLNPIVESKYKCNTLVFLAYMYTHTLKTSSKNRKENVSKEEH